MPVHNKDVSDILNELADLLDIEGANEFRVRSYREAAQTIEDLSENVRDKVEEGEDLTEIPGIGESMSDKMEEIVETGSLEQLEEMEQKVPEELSTLLNLEGLGPERVKDLHQELGIDSREDLEEAVENKEIRELEGFGKKTEANIREELERSDGEEERTMFSVAEEYAESLLEYLEQIEEIADVEMAGSYRRRKETVGDLDILVLCDDSEKVMDHYTSFEDVEEVVSKGETKSTIRLKSGLQVDLRVIAEESYGAAMMYFTGSKDHNIELRDRALDRDMKLNEYGLFDEDDEPVAQETEEEIYEVLDLSWITPELRENRGEVKVAEKGELPDLVTPEEMKGDIHMHTTSTDGKSSIKEMAEAARDMGHDYIAITDHSERVSVASGLDADELADQIKKVEEVDEELDDIRILKGIEVDILKDGTLDLPNDILKQLDLRICSVHYHQNLPEEEQTERIIKAMENPYFDILAHPTGRQIHERGEMDLDMEEIMDAAEEYDCIFELNASPHRLDLDDHYCKMAKERGLKIEISTDAHSIGELKYQRYGVYQARRGWLEAEDVINTYDVDELLEFFK